MLLLLMLISIAFAQDTAAPEPPDDALLQLEQILYALERVHPEIVNEVTHETHERECATALRYVTPRTAVPLAVCVRTSADHGVNVEDVEAIFRDLRGRYPGLMHAHSTEFWLEHLAAARKELRIQQALEREAAEQVEQVFEGALRERSSPLDSDSGMETAPID